MVFLEKKTQILSTHPTTSHTMMSFSYECSWIQHHMEGFEECIHCGNQRDITHNNLALRTVPVSKTPTRLDRWINR